MNTKANTSADFSKVMDTIRDEMAANAKDNIKVFTIGLERMAEIIW